MGQQAQPNPYAPPSVDNNVADQYQQASVDQQAPADYNQVVSTLEKEPISDSLNSPNSPHSSPKIQHPSESFEKFAAEDSDSLLTDSQFAALKAAKVERLTDDEDHVEDQAQDGGDREAAVNSPVSPAEIEHKKAMAKAALEIAEAAGVHQVPAVDMSNENKISDDDDDLVKAKKIMKAVGSAPTDPKDRRAWRKRTKALFRKYVSRHIFGRIVKFMLESHVISILIIIHANQL